MSNKVDKLFKEKLGEHSLPPSAQAWEKIEANLSKKNKAIIWFRVAAVIALVGAFTFALVQWNKQEGVNETLATKKDSVTQQKKVIQPELTLKENKPKASSEKKAVSRKEVKSSVKKEKAQEEFIPEIKREENPIALIKEEEKLKEDQVKITTTNPVAAKKSMKLTFSLPTIETKKEVKEEIMVADAPQEKKTTLQKAADVANDIRSGDVLGSLREAKNDLFAWEFKKDKSKKQQ